MKQRFIPTHRTVSLHTLYQWLRLCHSIWSKYLSLQNILIKKLPEVRTSLDRNIMFGDWFSCAHINLYGVIYGSERENESCINMKLELYVISQITREWRKKYPKQTDIVKAGITNCALLSEHVCNTDVSSELPPEMLGDRESSPITNSILSFGIWTAHITDSTTHFV